MRTPSKPTKSPKSPKSKDEIYLQVVTAAIQLDFKYGHLRWKMSHLARVAKVSRTLIYYYFGKSKQSIMSEALRILGQEVIGSTDERMALWKDGRWGESVLASRKFLHKHWELVPFYFIYRDNPASTMSEDIQKLEAEQIGKLKLFLPGLPHAKLMAIHAFLVGLAFGPNIPDAAITEGLQMIRAMIAQS